MDFNRLRFIMAQKLIDKVEVKTDKHRYVVSDKEPLTEPNEPTTWP